MSTKYRNLCGRLLYSTDGLLHSFSKLVLLIVVFSGPSDHAVLGVGLRPFACWDCGFESRRGMDVYLFVSVVCRQVEVSATGRTLVQRSSTKCYVSEWSRSLTEAP
jgi:hypothetical protein